MKTAGRENPNRWAKVAGNRASGADGQNRSSSIKWAVKQEKLQPMRKCFFLTSPFIELTGHYFENRYATSNSIRICTSSAELPRSRWTSKIPSPQVVMKLHTFTPFTSVMPDSVGLFLVSRMTCQ